MEFDLNKLISKEDISYEESISRDPNDVSTWISYYKFKINSLLENKLFIAFRAVKAIPNSKKLWENLIELILQEPNIHPNSVNEVFENCLINLRKEKSIWLQYIQYLKSQQSYDITKIRRTFNQCLQNLPIIEHKDIWPIYLEFADFIGGLTGVKIYLKYKDYLDPSALKGEVPNEMNLNNIIDKLREFGDIIESRKLYQQILENSNEYLNLPKSIVQNLFEYIDILIELPPRDDDDDDDVFEDIIECAMIDYPDQLGRLYLKVTEFFIKRNNIEKIRYYYNRGIKECKTLSDFVLIYDKYLEFEENQLIEDSNKEIKLDILLFRMDRFEELIDKRKMLINDALLRQNINNLDTWFTRFELVKDDLNKLIQTLTDAIRSINPLKVTTVKDYKLSQIWEKYIDIYASRKDYKTADIIYSKAVLSQFKDPDELAELYINWSEMLLGCDEFPENQAIEILQDLLEKQYDENNKTVQNKVIKSKKLREFYNDLIESFKL